MATIKFNGVGFNAKFISQVSIEEFIARHRHLWPEQKDRKKVEEDLRIVWDIIRNPKKALPSRSDFQSQ